MKTAINTRTQEEYDALMRYYESKGILWADEKKPLENNFWPKLGNETCVYQHSLGLMYHNLAHFEARGIPVIPYTEFAKANITESPNYEERYREAVELLDESRLQIEYLHGKFKATGTGINVLLKIDTFLTKHKDLTPSGE